MSADQLGAAVVAVLVAGGGLWRRRRLGRERTVLALLVAAGLAVYASGLLSELPDPQKVIDDVATALGAWTYALVGALAFLETGAFVGLVAPGETAVIAGGVIAGHGEIDLLPLIGLVWTCAVLGDTTSFLIGRRLGRGFLERHGGRVGITEERLRRVDGYFDRHGGKTILIGRFIGLVRALAPFVAGSSRMPYGRFVPFSVVGTGLWAATFSLLGYFFWQSFDRVADVAGQATLAFGAVVAAIVGVVWAYRRLRDEEQRRRLVRWIERQGRKPALRPLFALARPLWRRGVVPAYRLAEPRVRFAWERLTPGELGLELTTALAVAAAGLYVFALYAAVLAGDPGLTPFDREALDVAAELRTQPAVDVVRVATELGAIPVLAPVLVAAALVLGAKRRYYELAALLAGSALVFAAVRVAKAAIDRPRIEGSLVETAGTSFPSGHAAQSTAWVAVAVALSRVVPGVASTAGLVTWGLALSAVVGLSRMYLRAHYWSDVVGGWALGFGAYALVAATALVVAFVRQNGAGERPAGPAAATSRDP